MAKKTEKFVCDKCKYFNGICKHQSNILIKIVDRLEQIHYKNVEKKSECENFKCLEN